MFDTGVFRVRLSLWLGGAGLVTAGVNIGVAAFDGPQVLTELMGVYFGVAAALVLLRQGLVRAGSAAGLVISFAASWWLAFHLARMIYDRQGTQGTMLVAGAAGGLLGAAVVLGGLALFARVPLGRPASLAVLTIGTVAGLLLEVHYSVLFIVWQTAIGACIGWFWPADQSPAASSAARPSR